MASMDAHKEVAVKRLRIYCVFGLLLSMYAAHVEVRAEKDSDYVAWCDVNAKISCTAVFTTIYGRGFGIVQQLFNTDCPWIPPNGVIGFFFYSFLLMSTYWNSFWIDGLRLFLAGLSNVLSLYLAYLLYFVIHKFCFVCVAIYIVNYYCLHQIWILKKMEREQSAKKAL